MPIKTKEFASLLVAAVAAIVVAAAMWLLEAVWWQTLCVACAVFVGMTLLTLFIIRKYVAYKLKPIYSIVLSRNVHTQEILDELKDKHVENISEELTAWADTNDKEIARLKETESFRKQYLGNVAHELKTPIFNIQGYISTLLDGGLEDDLINRKYLERAEKSIDRLIDIVNDLDTISKLESNMTRLKMESFDIAAMTREIAEQAEIEADKKGIKIQVRGADSLPSPFWVCADKHFVGQVLVNLIINSIRYGKEGGVTRIKFRDMLDKILVEVEDQRRRYRQGGRAPYFRAVLPYGQGPFTRAGRYGARTGDRQAYYRSSRRANQRPQRVGSGNDLLVYAQKGSNRTFSLILHNV